jgi:acyl-coenzyme A thioesterase 13
MGYKDIPAGSILKYIKENFEGKLVVKHEMTNPYGNIHGGMMALVMDEVIGWAVVSLDMNANYTSLNLNVDFLYAIKQGDRLRAHANVVRAGKKIIHVECRIENMEGTLLGKASSNLIVTGMKPAEGDFPVAS